MSWMELTACCESFFFIACSHCLEASKACKMSWMELTAVRIIFLLQPLFGSIQSMQNVLNGADTDVVNLATTEVQFITSGIGLMIYGLHLHASGKSWITLLVIKYIADAFGPENASIYFFCLMWHLETVGKLECHLMRWPQHCMLFSIGTRSRFHSSSTAFVRMLCRTLYKLCMLRKWMSRERKCMWLTCTPPTQGKQHY